MKKTIPEEPSKPDVEKHPKIFPKDLFTERSDPRMLNQISKEDCDYMIALYNDYMLNHPGASHREAMDYIRNEIGLSKTSFCAQFWKTCFKSFLCLLSIPLLFLLILLLAGIESLWGTFFNWKA